MDDHMNDLHLMLGRIEAKLDATCDSLAKHVASEDAMIGQLVKRLSELENSKSFVLGMSAAVGAIVSWISTHFFTSK